MADHQDARLLVWSELGAEERAVLLRRTESDLSPYLEKAAAIIEAVRREGDAALCRFAAELDGADPPPEQLPRGRGRVRPRPRGGGRGAPLRPSPSPPSPSAASTKPSAPSPWSFRSCAPAFSSASAACRWTRSPAMSRAGKGAFPSVFLMTTLPAKVAGVSADRRPHPAGARRQGRPCDPRRRPRSRRGGALPRRRGPGRRRRRLRHRDDPRLPAHLGPGQPVGRRRPAACSLTGLRAASRRARARRSFSPTARSRGASPPWTSSWRPSTGPTPRRGWSHPTGVCAEEALAALPELLAGMAPERAAFARSVLSGPAGGILLVPDMEEACRFVNDYAPEHLLILAEDPFRWLPEIRSRRGGSARAPRADSARQLRPRPQRRPPHCRTGPHRLAPLGA